MNIEVSHSGNDMSVEEITELSAKINFNSLLAYRSAVAKRTQQVIQSLELDNLRRKLNKTESNDCLMKKPSLKSQLG